MKSDVTQVLIIEEGGDYEDVDEAQLPYVLVQNLGHGHSGNVEEVRDKHTNTTYARKTIAIPPNKATKIERMKVFKNEVEIIRGLDNHRHIVSVFATYATKRHFGIILQPVASDGDLGSFLSGYWDNISELDDSDSSAQRLTTMATVLERGFGCLASGLEFMHERNIRHKDIKPHNILVHKGRLIYTDFGYSFDSTGFSRSTTVGRPSFFTPRYSAPEVAEHEDRDSRSDVFSLGCVFFDMLLALTRTLHSEEIERFATKVCLLHKQILECQAPPSICTVPYVITKMTVYTALERFSASQAKIIILDSPGSGCLDCKAIDLDQRRSRGGAEEISTSTLMKPQNPQGSTSQHITETECLSNDNKLFKQDTVQCDADDHLPHHGHAHTSVYNATSAVDDSASTISTSHDAMSDCSGGPHRAKDHHLRSVREDDGEEDKTMETAKLDREAFSPRRVAKSDKRPTSSGVSVTRGRDHIFYANVTSTTSGTPDHSPNCSKRRGSWPQAIASPGNFKSIYPGYGSISDTSERRPWVWSDTSRSFNHITFDRNNRAVHAWYPSNFHTNQGTHADVGLNHFQLPPVLGALATMQTSQHNLSQSLNGDLFRLNDLTHVPSQSTGSDIATSPDAFSHLSPSPNTITSTVLKDKIPLVSKQETKTMVKIPISVGNEAPKFSTTFGIEDDSADKEDDAARQLANVTKDGAMLDRTIQGVIDPRLRTRAGPEASRFWAIGRVFSTTCWQSAGPPRPGKSLFSPISTIGIGKVGRPMIQEFIVVGHEEMQRSVYACPITTRKGHGVSEPGYSPAEHTIVHLSGTDPTYLVGEWEAGLRNEPLEIVPADPINQVLDPTSRLCLGIHIAVNWDVKAMDLGHVTFLQIPRLKHFVREAQYAVEKRARDLRGHLETRDWREGRSPKMPVTGQPGYLMPRL